MARRPGLYPLDPPRPDPRLTAVHAVPDSPFASPEGFDDGGGRGPAQALGRVLDLARAMHDAVAAGVLDPAALDLVAGLVEAGPAARAGTGYFGSQKFDPFARGFEVPSHNYGPTEAAGGAGIGSLDWRQFGDTGEMPGRLGRSGRRWLVSDGADTDGTSEDGTAESGDGGTSMSLDDYLHQQLGIAKSQLQLAIDALLRIATAGGSVPTGTFGPGRGPEIDAPPEGASSAPTTAPRDSAGRVWNAREYVIRALEDIRICGSPGCDRRGTTPANPDDAGPDLLETVQRLHVPDNWRPAKATLPLRVRPENPESRAPVGSVVRVDRRSWVDAPVTSRIAARDAEIYWASVMRRMRSTVDPPRDPNLE